MKRHLVAAGAAVAVALLAFSAGCETPSSPSPLRGEQGLSRADELFLQGQFGQAAGLYEAHLSDAPHDPQAAALRVKAGKAWLGAGQPERAVQQLDRALASAPAPPLRLEALFRRSVAQRQMGDAVRALDGLRQIETANPEDLDRAGLTIDEVAWEKAQAHFRVNDWRNGQSELSKISPKGPYGDLLRSRAGLTSWTVQIGAFADNGPARSLAGRVPGAHVREVAGAPPLWIVTVGTYPRHDDARRALDRLKPAHPDAFLLP